MDKSYEIKSFIAGMIGGGIIGNLLPDFLRQHEIITSDVDNDKVSLLQAWLIVIGVALLCIWIVTRELEL
jgi:ABC-type phosphate/phosphonate transport system permease subunit